MPSIFSQKDATALRRVLARIAGEPIDRPVGPGPMHAEPVRCPSLHDNSATAVNAARERARMM